MTREEKIRQASIEYTYRNTPMCIGGGAFSEMVDELNRNKSFEEGAKWADKTMVDKACEWFEDVDFEMTYIDSEGLFDKEQLINDFRKAMEE